nr:chromatin modification-related protein EAF1 B-like isoform X1 [Tanacetum cinerariifolium]
DKEDQKQLQQPHSSHALALSQVFPNNLNGGPVHMDEIILMKTIRRGKPRATLLGSVLDPFTNDTKVSIPCVERPWLSEAEGFILPNHDTSMILPPESQTNTTEPPVAITDSSATDQDSVNESSVCSTPVPPLEKLGGAELASGTKAIKSILNSNSTFKMKASKIVSINEPSSAPAKINKNASASKINSAPAEKLKHVKTKDDVPLSIVMKELNDLRL